MLFDFWGSDFDPIAFSDVNLANRNSIPMRILKSKKFRWDFAYLDCKGRVIHIFSSKNTILKLELEPHRKQPN